MSVVRGPWSVDKHQGQRSTNHGPRATNMAASDQFYRKQKTLDLVFGVSSALMLASIVGMFIQDYYRSWKPEQRNFRPVESAISLREALSDIPSKERFEEAR